MIRVKRIDHVAIAVAGMSDYETRLRELFGARPGAREHVATQKTDVAFLHAADGETTVELIAPAGNESLQKFVDKRGTALHHICFEVDDIRQALTDLKAAGVPLVDETPRPGARGHLVAFLHPKATGGVLFELCQATAGHAP